MGINRNIVECKVKIAPPNARRPCVLIETLWNVKIYTSQQTIYCVSVLIETLWNVKTYWINSAMDLAIVLIETLWNVKLPDL